MGTQVEATEVFLVTIGGGMPSLCSLSALLVSPRKELINLSEVPIFVTGAQGTTPGHLALEVSGVKTQDPTGLYILHFLKAIA